jgi:methyltransferase-like protein/ubiquinone/menaquinone biosynthesis C-methylase UbiE
MPAKMPESTHTLYDEVLYPSALYRHTHPDRLAMMATLFGLKPSPVEACRVLELGCGDGTNLIPMAYAMPRSHFVGIDLAQRPIAAGQETIKELGLNNVSLRQLDLMQTPYNLGPFDYIIAHGLYSWVPEAVRDKLLALCGAFLTENGVAYVSYNAYPGSHFRDLTRGMMLYHVAQFADPDQKIQQARALLNFIADSKEEPEPYHQIIKNELNQVLNRPASAIFHDNLSAINQPVYFCEFIEHAAHHGLQYLSEANLWGMHMGSYPPSIDALLSSLDPADVIAREQYNDFLEGRPFRRTLLCRTGITIDRSLQPERLYGLRFAADLRPAVPTTDDPSLFPQVFKGPAGAELETRHSLVKVALTQLGKIWPQSLAFEDLLTDAQAHLGGNHENSPTEEDRLALAKALMQAHLAACLELHAYQAPFVTVVNHRPVASALARLQARKGSSISTLRHEALRLDDSLSRQLVLLLDGTRDHADLSETLSALIKSGAITGSHEGEPAADVDVAAAYLREVLETSLCSLARHAVLVA